MISYLPRSARVASSAEEDERFYILEPEKLSEYSKIERIPKPSPKKKGKKAAAKQVKSAHALP